MHSLFEREKQGTYVRALQTQLLFTCRDSVYYPQMSSVIWLDHHGGFAARFLTTELLCTCQPLSLAAVVSDSKYNRRIIE